MMQGRGANRLRHAVILTVALMLLSVASHLAMGQ